MRLHLPLARWPSLVYLKSSEPLLFLEPILVFAILSEFSSIEKLIKHAYVKGNVNVLQCMIIFRKWQKVMKAVFYRLFSDDNLLFFTLNSLVPKKLLKMRIKRLKAAETEDIFDCVWLWKGVIFSIGGETSWVVLENLDFVLLHQTFTLKAVSNDKTFLCVKLKVTALKILSIWLFLFLTPP